MRGRGPGGTRCGRVLSVLLVLAALQLGSLVAPAYACGCGAMVPSERSRIAVGRETSVVHWDGRTEQIVMRLTVHGDAREAAWIMPVPHRASVELGEAALFDELAEITAPVWETRHHFWPRDGDWPFGERDGAGAPAPGAAAAPVGVVDRRRLGPFDVARLTATDPDALRTWLEGNGFALPGPLEAALRPYVDQGWEYVAVRLAPEEAGAVLTGALDPLRLRFASDRPVYPMRLSRLARTAQSLGLYVIAEHRMEPSGAIGGREPEVTFAGRLERTVPDGAVAGLVGDGPAFLTAFDQSFPDPSRIDGDHELRAAAADTPYRTVRHRDELLAVGGVPAWPLSVLAVLLLAVAVALRAVRRRRAR